MDRHLKEESDAQTCHRTEYRHHRRSYQQTLKDNPEITISHSKAVIATRNRVIHDCGKSFINDLPKLKEEVTALLADNS